MAEDIASLGLKVDSAPVAAASVALDKLADSATRVDTATQGAESASEALGQASRDLAASSTKAVSAQQAQINGLLALSRASDESLKAVTKQGAADTAKKIGDEAAASLRQLAALTTGSAAAQQAQSAALLTSSRTVQESLKATAQQATQVRESYDPLLMVYKQVPVEQAKVTKSAGELRQAYRLLPAQITDVVTSLASGSPAYLVAIQQGGQLRDSFGSVGGVFKALGTLITPTRILIGGAAAAAALLATAWYQGASEGPAFTKAIALSGNAAGTTSTQLQNAAANVAKYVGTQHQAAGIIAELTTTGKVANDQLQVGAQLAIQLSRSFGIATDETVKAFAGLGARPSEAIKSLNDQYHFLTASTYAQILALEDEGKKTEAAALAQQTFATALGGRAKDAEQNLGYLQRAARGATDAAKGMWDALLDIGREESAEEKLTKKLKTIESKLSGDARGSFADDGVASLDRAPPSGADRSALEAQRAQAQADLNQEKTQQLRAQNAAARRSAQAAAEEAAVKDAEVRRSAAQAARQQAQQDADARAKAALNSRISAIQIALHAELDAYSQQGDLLDAQHQANLVSDTDYYAQKRRLIEASTDAQVKALDAENRVLAQGAAAARNAAAVARAAADSLAGKGSADYGQALATATRKASEAQQVRLDNDDKIKANSAEITRLKSAEASQEEVLRVNEEARGKALTRSYEQAKLAADNYLATLAKQYKLQERDQFTGQQQRDFDTGRSSIEDKYAQQEQQVEIDRSNNPKVDSKIYDQRKALIKSTLADELALYDAHWKALRQGETSWLNGANEALRNYADEAKNTAKSAQTFISDIAGDLEDSLTSGFTTGKFKVKSFIDSVIAEFVRLQVVKPLLGQLANGLSSKDGGGGGWLQSLGSIFGGGRASGGGVDSGRLYEVNEGGRMEAYDIPGRASYLMTGSSSGSVVPNHALGGHSTNVTQNIISNYPISQRTAAQLAREAGRRQRVAAARFG